VRRTWLYSYRHHRVSGVPVVGPQAGERDPLRRLQVAQKADKLRRGLREMPPWVFPSVAGTPLDDANVEKALKRVLKAGEVPLHYTPHCPRHTLASLLLQQGCHRRTYSASSVTRRFS
jgi:integrase